MTTSSEKGIRILDESHYYWVWSAHGEADQGMYYNRSFVAGRVPCPLPGDIAGELESHGFMLTEYVEGEWSSHWESDNHSFRQKAVFEPIAKNEPFPPKELPEKLPPEWLEFFGKYTSGGKLRKEKPAPIETVEVPEPEAALTDGD